MVRFLAAFLACALPCSVLAEFHEILWMNDDWKDDKVKFQPEGDNIHEGGKNEINFGSTKHIREEGTKSCEYVYHDPEAEKRVELHSKRNFVGANEGTTLYIGWSDYYAELPDFNVGGITTFQMREIDYGFTGGPPVEMTMGSGGVSIGIKGGRTANARGDITGPTQLGVWYDYVLKINLEKDNSGELKVWAGTKDTLDFSTPQFDYTGPTMWSPADTENGAATPLWDYNGSPGDDNFNQPQIRIGNYMWGCRQDPACYTTTYKGPVRIFVGADGQAGYNQVVPRGSTDPNSTNQPTPVPPTPEPTAAPDPNATNQPTPLPGACEDMGAAFVSTALDNAIDGDLSASFTMESSSGTSNAVFMLSSAALADGDYAGGSIAVRFKEGNVEARNGGAYVTSSLAHGTSKVTFAITGDVAAKTYSVTATKAGSAPVVVATDFAFRTGAPAGPLTHMTVVSATADAEFCDAVVTDGTTAPASTENPSMAGQQPTMAGEQPTMAGNTENPSMAGQQPTMPPTEDNVVPNKAAGLAAGSFVASLLVAALVTVASA